VRERFSYNENNIDDQKLLALFKVHQHLAPELSYYEFLFYIFCQWIEELPLDFLILEVGLGGRLDCVNCFDADIAAITSISRDHTEYLGDNLEQILTEKLGVSRRNRPLLSTVYQPELRTKLREFEREKAYQLKDLFELGVISNKDTFSHTNQKLASELFTLLNGNTVEDEDWDDFLPGVGRGRVINTRWGSILAMGSHNAEGLLALESWLEWRVEKDFDGIFVGLSKRPTRDLSQCIKIIFETLKKRTVQLQLVGFDHPKAAPWSLMENALSEDSHLKREFDQSYCDFESWWELFEEKDNPKAQYLLTGSYYFIATVFNALDRAGVLIQ
jgi:dihydrofolate synthase/folylpolyglutamate synthase